jgi:hypothetical protein
MEDEWLATIEVLPKKKKGDKNKEEEIKWWSSLWAIH